MKFAYIYIYIYIYKSYSGDPKGVVVNVVDCDIVVSEIKITLCNYVFFVSHTVGKVVNILIPQAMS